MDFITAEVLDRAGAVVILLGVMVLVITDRLVPGSRLRAAEARADRWEGIAIEALSTGAQASVRAAEVAVGVVSAIPDPERDRRAHQDREGGVTA